MSRVVILHAEDDGAPARALAEKLRMMRLSTVYDEPPGPELREEMEAAICTMALWSPRSSARPDLIGEAAFAHNTGRLVHVRMHNAEPPLEFSQDPSVNLTGWRGEDEFPAWRELAAVITAHLDAARAAAAAPPPPPPAPPPAPDLGFGALPEAPPAHEPPRFEPPAAPAPAAPAPGDAFRHTPPAGDDIYADPPKRSSSTIQLAVIGVLTFLVVAAVGIGGYSLYQNQHNAAEAARVWRGVDQTDADALRAFLEGPYAGQYRAEAEAALEGLELARLEDARREDSIDSLEAFLADFPESRHVVQVRGRLAELRQSGAGVGGQIEPPEALAPLPDPGDAPNLAEPAPLAPSPNAAVPLAPRPAPDAGGPTPLTPPRSAQDTERDLRRALESDAGNPTPQ